MERPLKPQATLADLFVGFSLPSMALGILIGAALAAVVSASWLALQQTQEVSAVLQDSTPAYKVAARPERERVSSAQRNRTSSSLSSSVPAPSASTGAIARQEWPLGGEAQSTPQRAPSTAPASAVGLKSEAGSHASSRATVAASFVEVEISPATPLARQSAHLFQSGRLDAATANALQRAQQNFEREVAAAPSAANPTSEEFFDTWQQASARSDYALKAWLGWEAFNALSLEARRQAVTSSGSMGNLPPSSP